MLRSTIVFSIILVSFFTAPTYAQVGRKGNGGDFSSLQFAYIGEKIAGYFTSHSESMSFDTRAFADAVRTVTVEATDQPLPLNSMIKDAINYPSLHKIVINRLNWEKSNSTDRVGLVLHEYLSLLGLESANYAQSKLILANYISAVGEDNFVAYNPYDPTLDSTNIRLDEVVNCAQLISDHSLCPVLDIGTMSKIELKQTNQGTYWLVWKPYWVNHRPVLSSLSVTVAFQPTGSKNVVFTPVYGQVENTDMEDTSPNLIFISLKASHVVLRQLWIQSSPKDGSTKQTANLPLVEFDLGNLPH